MISVFLKHRALSCLQHQMEHRLLLVLQHFFAVIHASTVELESAALSAALLLIVHESCVHFDRLFAVFLLELLNQTQQEDLFQRPRWNFLLSYFVFSQIYCCLMKGFLPQKQQISHRSRWSCCLQLPSKILSKRRDWIHYAFRALLYELNTKLALILLALKIERIPRIVNTKARKSDA